MSKDVKQLRGQVRIAVKELLPEIMTQEQYALLKKHMDSRIEELEKFMKETLSEMNARHKDTMSYLIRQTTSPLDKKD